MKTHHTGFHSVHEQPMGLADQDAAIDAYLDGLLRDPDSEPYWSADDMDVVDDYDEGYSEEAVGDFEQIKRSVGLSLVDLSKFKAGVIEEPGPAEMKPPSPPPEKQVRVKTSDTNLSVEVLVEPVVEQEVPVVMTPEEPSSDALSLEMSTKESVVELSEQDEATASVTHAEPPVAAVEQKVESDWQVFALGHLKVALPRAEIFNIVDDSSLRPIPGAPATLAGAVSYQERSRMILSLDAWLPKVTSDARVVLLGAQGLWGVRVGAELTDLTWDEAETSWRDASERNAGRPWLVGVNRAAGVAFLAVESLRSALSAPR
jgi:purine-binding chemotaxis protein CheW